MIEGLREAAFFVGAPLQGLPSSASKGPVRHGKDPVAGGTPMLTVNDGGTASYASGSGTNALTLQLSRGRPDRTRPPSPRPVNCRPASPSPTAPATRPTFHLRMGQRSLLNLAIGRQRAIVDSSRDISAGQS